MTVKIVDNGMSASISIEDILDKHLEPDLTLKYNEGDVFKARIKSIDVRKFKVELSRKQADFKITNQTFLDIVPKWSV